MQKCFSSKVKRHRTEQNIFLNTSMVLFIYTIINDEFINIFIEYSPGYGKTKRDGIYVSRKYLKCPLSIQ